jgi:hypothetical protein
VTQANELTLLTPIGSADTITLRLAMMMNWTLANKQNDFLPKSSL